MLWKTAALAAAAPNPGVHKLWVLIALAVRRVWTNFRVGSRIHRDTPGFPPKGCGSPLKNPQIYPHLLIFPALRAENRGWPGRMQATTGQPRQGTAKATAHGGHGEGTGEKEAEPRARRRAR